MDKDVLLSCPWCRKSDKLETRKSYVIFMWCVLCRRCGCEGPLENTEKEAVERWNQRSAPQERCELEPLNEKLLEKFLIEQSRHRGEYLSYELNKVATLICQKFGTAPAQKTSYQEIESVMVNGVDFVPKSAQRCELRKLDEKTLENFLDDYSTENPDFNHIKGLSKEICSKFGTPAQRSLSLEEIEQIISNHEVIMKDQGVSGELRIFLKQSLGDYSESVVSELASAIKAKLDESVPVQKTLSEADIADIIKKDIVGKNAMENWGVKDGDNFMQVGEIANNRFHRLATAIKAKMDAQQPNEGATK